MGVHLSDELEGAHVLSLDQASSAYQVPITLIDGHQIGYLYNTFLDACTQIIQFKCLYTVEILVDLICPLIRVQNVKNQLLVPF